MSKPPRTQARKTNQQLAIRALELRKAGLSHRQIALALEITQARARRLVSRLLEDLDPDEQVALELARLDAAIIALAKRVKEGEFGAIDRWLKLCESRRKLLGLDRPRLESPPPPPAPQKLYANVDTENV